MSALPPGRRSPRRRVIWDWLTAHPGLTAHEIARAAFRRPSGPGLVAGDIYELLQRMEADGEVTSVKHHQAQQGRPVSRWSAVPGAYPQQEET